MTAVAADGLPGKMRFLFLGTGGANHNWSDPYQPEFRGSTAALIDGRILIDAGPTVFEALENCGVDFDAIDTLLFTHSHPDHFKRETVERILLFRCGPPLRVFAIPQILARLDGLSDLDLHPIRPGESFTAAGYDITALWASHTVEDLSEESLHFLFERNGHCVLYALDGAWMTCRTRAVLSQRKITLHSAIFDCTTYEGGHYRSFEHNDMAMLRLMIPALREWNIITADTRIVLDHIAREYWPNDRAACSELAARDGMEVAYDGLTLDL